MENIFNHKFIIFGTYSANTLGQIRSLGEAGIRPIAVLVYRNSFRIDKSKYLAKIYNVDSIEEGIDLIQREFGFEEKKPFLYTDRDDIVGLLDKRYGELIDKFYFWNSGGKGHLSKYLNKEEQIKLAKECGFDVPETEVVKVGELPTRLSYPIFTKAVDSLDKWWKGRSFICQNESELLIAYQKMKGVERIMLQQFIDKQNEVPYEGLSVNGGDEIKVLVKSVNYRFTKDSYGIYRHLEIFHDDELEEKMRRFIRSVQYSGVFEIEQIVDKKGRAYFLEANFRVTQYNFAYAKFGVNFPYIYAMSVLQNKLYLEGVKFSEKRPFNVMSEFEDFRISCIHGDISFVKWIKDVMQTDCFQYFDKHDKIPFFFTLLSKLVYSFRKMKKCINK